MLVEATDRSFAALIDAESIDGWAVAPGGLESASILKMLRALALQVRSVRSPAAWLMVESDEIVGLCSLMAAPDRSGAIEIGYGVAASRRGKGIASRAIADLVRVMADQRGITALTANTAIDNLASQKVLQNNGFRKIGRRTDAVDGELICWRLDIVTSGNADVSVA